MTIANNYSNNWLQVYFHKEWYKIKLIYLYCVKKKQKQNMSFCISNYL